MPVDPVGLIIATVVEKQFMGYAKLLLAGLAGSTVLTLTHQLLRYTLSASPRLDLLGMQAMEKGLKRLHLPVPQEPALFGITLAGDVLGNAAYYSLGGMAGVSRKRLTTILGIAAGIGAVALPGKMHLDPSYTRKSLSTTLLTVALYTAGGIVAGVVMDRIAKS